MASSSDRIIGSSRRIVARGCRSRVCATCWPKCEQMFMKCDNNLEWYYYSKYMLELSRNVFLSDSTKQCQTMQRRGGVRRVWGNMGMFFGVCKTRVWQGRAKTTVICLVLNSWGALIWFRTYLNCFIAILYRSMLIYIYIYIYIVILRIWETNIFNFSWAWIFNYDRMTFLGIAHVYSIAFIIFNQYLVRLRMDWSR